MWYNWSKSAIKSVPNAFFTFTPAAALFLIAVFIEPKTSISLLWYLLLRERYPLLQETIRHFVLNVHFFRHRFPQDPFKIDRNQIFKTDDEKNYTFKTDYQNLNFKFVWKQFFNQHWLILIYTNMKRSIKDSTLAAIFLQIDVFCFIRFNKHLNKI